MQAETVNASEIADYIVSLEDSGIEEFWISPDINGCYATYDYSGDAIAQVRSNLANWPADKFEVRVRNFEGMCVATVNAVW